MIADTGLFIDFFRRSATAREFLDEHDAVVVVPFVVRAELLTGAFRAADVTAQVERVGTYLDTFPALWPNRDTTTMFARVRWELDRAGTPIGTHDVWIAAFARQYGLPLATQDAHFKRVAGLTLARWDA